MKVGMVVPGGVDRTGTERVIPCLLAAVERIARVHELHVFALSQEARPARWALRGAWVHNAGRRPVRVTALAQLLAEHRRAPFDVLHGVWASCGTVADRDRPSHLGPSEPLQPGRGRPRDTPREETSTPRTILPPPITTATSTPSFCAAIRSSAMRSTVG